MAARRAGLRFQQRAATALAGANVYDPPLASERSTRIADCEHTSVLQYTLAAST